MSAMLRTASRGISTCFVGFFHPVFARNENICVGFGCVGGGCLIAFVSPNVFTLLQITPSIGSTQCRRKFCASALFFLLFICTLIQNRHVTKKNNMNFPVCSDVCCKCKFSLRFALQILHWRARTKKKRKKIWSDCGICRIVYKWAPLIG